MDRRLEERVSNFLVGGFGILSFAAAFFFGLTDDSTRDYRENRAKFLKFENSPQDRFIPSNKGKIIVYGRSYLLIYNESTNRIVIREYEKENQK